MRNPFWLLFKRIKNHGYRLTWYVLFLCVLKSHGQAPFYNFTHVTTSDGLSNATVRGITQDKYGYIWIGSVNGLSRYNGYDVKIFLHSAKDPLSIPDNLVIGLFCDADNNLWVIFPNGLYRYEDSTSHFILQEATRGLHIHKILQQNRDTLYLSTSNGLAIFNPSKATLNFPYKSSNALSKILLKKSPYDLCIHNHEGLYFTTDTGLVLYHPAWQRAELVSLPKVAADGVEKIAIDQADNIWISYGENRGKVLRIAKDHTSVTSFPEFSKNANNHISGFLCDSHNNLWICTSEQGLARYDSAYGKFIFFANSPFELQSISSFNLTDIFQDRQGFLWVGTEGYGLNYFQPDNNLFHTVLPVYQKGLSFSDGWARAVAEDKNGNLWLGSVNGIALYNTSDGSCKVLQNNKDTPHQLYSNSVRALLYDDHEFLWIGTSLGLNRYNTKNGHMDFLGGNNLLPLSFFKSIIQDKNKNIWIGCRDGLYRFNYTTSRFEHFENDPLFTALRNYNIQTIFEDSHQKFWFGTYSNGVFTYDENKKIADSIQAENKLSSFSKNIRSFAESKDGNIWIAGSNGLASVSAGSGGLKMYNEEQGLTTVNAAGLLIDKHNRLWIGTGKGLYVLDSTRKNFTSFSLRDGLPTLEFNEQVAYKTSNGNFVYPTLKGFLFFNPDNYKEAVAKVDVYISDFKVFNKKYLTGTNPEDLQNLRLPHDNNFFSFELTGINYGSPEQTSYAYKLEPFDKDWTYTKERVINYTNVPGGNYVFHYKASANENWNVPGKILGIYVAQVFYKTVWFWCIIALLASATLYRIYQYRFAQTEKIYSLQSKAHALEKEKAIVQYESLKQQLNPHFLFNSLTSLRSLIRINRENAADFLDKLSLNYRYILKSSESELVPLRDELQFAGTYIDLQQVRFGSGLTVVIKVPGDKQYRKIVPVTIQNLIENAIKHNIIDTDNPLQINIFEKDDYLIVQNNLQLKESVEASNQYGLKHLTFLYQYLDKRPLLIEKDAGFFTVKIPLI